ncbi:MAG: type II toxin-antitoxin system VapB family antitoxin [Desulfobacteraceae bacterium]|jgi:antitoxin VapB
MDTAKIFKSGNSQAVRLPKDFQFDVSEVQILKRGDEVVLKKKPQNLSRAYELLTELSDDFMKNGREQLPVQERESF